MAVILRTDHLKIVRDVKRRALVINLICITVAVLALMVPYVCKLERDLITEAYRVAKGEFNSVMARQELLNVLRSKPMTIGQTLDIVDVVMSQREVPIPIVLGVIAQESSFKPEAVSDKGARGLMQVLPGTYASYSKNPLLKDNRLVLDPALNVRVGISYLGDLQKNYGDWKKSLRAYLAGPEHSNDKTYDPYALAVLAKAEKYEKQIGSR
jgi:soluble lytic murein transglycosylase-like protein